MEMLDKGMGRDSVTGLARFHHETHNDTEFKTYTLLKLMHVSSALLLGNPIQSPLPPFGLPDEYSAVKVRISTFYSKAASQIIVRLQ